MNSAEIIAMLSDTRHRDVLVRVLTENYWAGLYCGRGINQTNATYDRVWPEDVVECVRKALDTAMFAQESYVSSSEMVRYMEQDSVIYAAYTAAQGATPVTCYIDAIRRMADANKASGHAYPNMLLDLVSSFQ